MFWIKYKANRYTVFFYIEVGFKEVLISWTCFSDDERNQGRF